MTDKTLEDLLNETGFFYHEDSHIPCREPRKCVRCNMEKAFKKGKQVERDRFKPHVPCECGKGCSLDEVDCRERRAFEIGIVEGRKKLTFIIDIMEDFGLSNIESERIFESKGSFKAALEDVIEKQTEDSFIKGKTAGREEVCKCDKNGQCAVKQDCECYKAGINITQARKLTCCCVTDLKENYTYVCTFHKALEEKWKQAGREDVLKGKDGWALIKEKGINTLQNQIIDLQSQIITLQKQLEEYKFCQEWPKMIMDRNAKITILQKELEEKAEYQSHLEDEITSLKAERKQLRDALRYRELKALEEK